MNKTLKDIVVLIIINTVLTLLIWLPFIFQSNPLLGLDFSSGFSTIYRNYDGIEYIVIAKTLYSPELLSQIPQNLSSNYYPSHFPGFSLAIALFAPLAGYLKSMILVSFLFTIGSVVIFYLLVKRFELTSQPVWLSVVFLILPARWVIVHSVGSAEPMFIFFTLLAIYFYKSYESLGYMKFMWFCAFASAAAQITRPPGILIFISIILYALYKNFKKHRWFSPISIFIPLIKTHYPMVLVPVSLLAIFTLFHFQLGNFWAYFNSGDNIHLTLPPFSVFNKYQAWVGDIWLEDIIYILFIAIVGGIRLLKSPLGVSGVFVLVYTMATIFVAHRDISRYILPTMPFILIGIERVINTKEFKIAAIILFAAIYLYSQNFIIENTAPIENLSVFN